MMGVTCSITKTLRQFDITGMFDGYHEIDDQKSTQWSPGGKQKRGRFGKLVLKQLQRKWSDQKQIGITEGYGNREWQIL